MQWLRNTPLAEEPPAPEELILYRVAQAAASDEILPAVFPDRLRAWDVIPPPAGTGAGALRKGQTQEYCIGPQTYHDIPRPGLRNNEFVIFHVLRFEWMTMEPLPGLEVPGLSRLLRRVFRVFTSPAHFYLPISATLSGAPLASEVCMVTGSEPGTVRPVFEPIDQNQAALSIIVPWTYTYGLKPKTDRILDLDSAGFYDA